MLRELSIRSFALIDEIDLTFGTGMTCLVGETGAGKSILIDALSAALGSRMAADLIRPGARKAVVEAIFDVRGRSDIRQTLQQADLDWEEEHLILRRELTSSGTSRCFVNDTPSTVSVVRMLADLLMDFHGQHDTYGLLDTRQHLTILDGLAGLGSLGNEMRQTWANLQHATQAYDRLRAMAASADEERARLEFVIREIAEIAPRSTTEDSEIIDELRRAESREQILTSAVAARDALYAESPSAYELLVSARDHLRTLIPFDASLQGVLDELEAAATTCKEGAVALAELADVEDFSPERLDELRQRLTALQRLVKKYGSLDAALEVRALRSAELEQLTDLDGALERGRAEVASAKTAAERVAAKLHKQRAAAVKPLAASITSTLTALGMPSARVQIHVAATDLGPTGADRVEILFSANAGEEPRPLARIASGGELSRFMLALKKAQVADTSIGSMVFDEIDTGISGKIARKVGEEMRSLASHHQVICITHLPQIASLATTMIRVEKQEAADRATVTATVIDRPSMVVEVARLMSGTEISEATLKGAEELMSPTRT